MSMYCIYWQNRKWRSWRFCLSENLETLILYRISQLNLVTRRGCKLLGESIPNYKSYSSLPHSRTISKLIPSLSSHITLPWDNHHPYRRSSLLYTTPYPPTTTPTPCSYMWLGQRGMTHEFIKGKIGTRDRFSAGLTRGRILDHTRTLSGCGLRKSFILFFCIPPHTANRIDRKD